ncbi:hypothetical protein W02_24590 [Nitrospira sp. KM1]|uniref:phytanoyl-CoA dioxygenase family protein n=1 Tax=Nitrospira sp. KM1 TaxID=1936990 RepID=UPI0013A72F71|nr:phytanoyl-CoA dioxygenase family protein [Nitrospira sp. KM1]BCA55319.1 hypothetical protein W02_24590 [Nitrospira sp. KM1]
MGINILFIDGDTDDHKYFVDRLKRIFPDDQILEASSGNIGRELLHRERIDCLVLELDLPDMSGFQILVDAVPVASAPRLPVIVLTRLPNRDIWELAKRNGAYACLWKPCTTGDVLVSTIERGLAQIAPQGKEPNSLPLPHIGQRRLTSAEIATFHQDGFLSVSHLTTPNDIAHLRRLIDPLFRSSCRTFGVIDHVLKLAPAIRHSAAFQTCQRIAQQLAGITTRVSFDQALYKRPHELHGTRWHQDQAFRNRHFPMNTLHFWIPLQPVTTHNGCLHFIPGSHQQGLLPHYQIDENDPYAITPQKVDTSHAVPCPLSVGSATIHTPLTLHAALPNNTEEIRRAWALVFRPFGRIGALNPFPAVRQLFTH